MTQPVLHCHQIVKVFKGGRAVDDLDLTVRQGSVFGLLGPNGSGKTTTIRISLGVFPPDAGSVELLGATDPLAVRHRVGYLPEERGLYAKMKVQEQLAFLGCIRGLAVSEAQRRATAWLERLGLAERAGALTNELSKGMQQKVQFASAVIHEPELVILDEPFTGLDPVNTRLLKDLILEQQARGVTVVLSTHRMEQVEALCDSICLIHQGRAVVSGELAAIKASYGRNTIALTYEGDAATLQGIPGLLEVSNSGKQARLKMEKGVDSQAILRQLLDRVFIHSVQVEEPHLEEIYIEKVGGQSESRLRRSGEEAGK